MARFRKVDVRIWGDAEFRGYSDRGKVLFLYLITPPESTSVPGLFAVSRAGIADLLGWSLEAFDEAFREVSRKGKVKADWKARVVWVPNAKRYNTPESPNVVKSWEKHLDEVPECALKVLAIKDLEAFTQDLGKAFREAFSKAYAKGMANQEQEQEQEQEERDRRPAPSPEGAQVPPSATHLTLSGEAPSKPALNGKAVEAVFAHWSAVLMPKAKRTDKREVRIKARLKEGFTAEQLIQAVDGAKRDPFLMGEDPKSRPGGYRDIDTVFRDAGQVERLMALADVCADGDNEWPAESRRRVVAELDDPEPEDMAAEPKGVAPPPEFTEGLKLLAASMRGER